MPDFDPLLPDLPTANLLPLDNNISTIMFLQPEVAGVGMNEQDCRRLKIPYRAATYACELI